MERFLYIIMLFLPSLALLTMALSGFDVLTDNNSFLSDFINHELLNTLGFMLAILISTCVIINENLNRMSAQYSLDVFPETRITLKNHVFGGVFVFIFCFVIVIFKHAIADQYKSVVNAVGLSAVFYFCLSLLDVALTSLAFRSTK